MNLNIDAKKALTGTPDCYDAIVIGSGVSGGWAAKNLTEKGLRVLMLIGAAPWNTLRAMKPPCKSPGKQPKQPGWVNLVRNTRRLRRM